MAKDVQYLLDEVLHAGSLAVPIRVKLVLQGWEGPGEHRATVVGLNLVQADPELGSYVELEVEVDT